MRIGFVGDLILSPCLKVDKELIEILNGTDLNIANLEAPFIRNGMQPVQKAGLHQLVDDCSILQTLNIAAVSLANNHMGDFGPEGIEITRQVLSDHDILCFGAGKDMEEAIKPAEIIIDNRMIHCWGFMQRFGSKRYFATNQSAGIPELRRDIILPELQNSRADIKILYSHWNQEFEHYPEPINKYLTEEISRHCNLVIGSHPHCLQGIQSSDRSTIFHSLGNFSIPALEFAGVTLMEFPDIYRDSVIIIIELDKKKPGYSVYPIVQDRSGCIVSHPGMERSQQIKSHLHTISEPLALAYREYRQFYKKNRQRKMLPMQVRNRSLNLVLVTLYYSVNRLLMFVEIKLAAALEKMGILSVVKRRMSRILDYIHSNR